MKTKYALWRIALLLIVSALLFTGCNFETDSGNKTPDESSTDSVESDESESVSESESESESEQELLTTTEDTEDETDPPAEPEKQNFRVLLTSDMHYTLLGSGYYGTPRDTRLQYWVNDILAEHAKTPFDLILIMGDMSLDYWGWNGGGTYQRNPKTSDTKLFIEKFVSQLPQDVPIVILPGNHELYTNEKWKEITGFDRNCSFVLGNNLFVMPDSFSGASDPAYQGGGKNDSPYAPVDVNFIQGEIDKHPECDKIFLVSHHFDINKESQEFKNLLKNETRIVGLFSGHTHSSAVINLGSEYRNLKIAQTGCFASYSTQNVANFNWGFRDLIIFGNTVTSRYLVQKHDFYVDGVKYTSVYKTQDNVLY